MRLSILSFSHFSLAFLATDTSITNPSQLSAIRANYLFLVCISCPHAFPFQGKPPAWVRAVFGPVWRDGFSAYRAELFIGALSSVIIEFLQSPRAACIGAVLLSSFGDWLATNLTQPFLVFPRCEEWCSLLIRLQVLNKTFKALNIGTFILRLYLRLQVFLVMLQKTTI